MLEKTTRDLRKYFHCHEHAADRHMDFSRCCWQRLGWKGGTRYYKLAERGSLLPCGRKLKWITSCSYMKTEGISYVLGYLDEKISKQTVGMCKLFSFLLVIVQQEKKKDKLRESKMKECCQVPRILQARNRLIKLLSCKHVLPVIKKEGRSLAGSQRILPRSWNLM